MCGFRSAIAGSGRPKTRSFTTWRFRRAGTRCGRGSACGVSAWTARPATRCSTASPISSAAPTLCIYRFFADPKRGDLPWREDWVRKLHRTFKDMHWNSIRYCIGFPPEMWYRIADEEGLLIQDEFPLWYMNSWPKEITSESSDPAVYRVDARALEPSVRGDLGRPERDRGRPDGHGARGLTETGKTIRAVRALGPLEPALGQRLGPARGAERQLRGPSLRLRLPRLPLRRFRLALRRTGHSGRAAMPPNCRTPARTRSSSTNTAGGTSAATASRRTPDGPVLRRPPLAHETAAERQELHARLMAAETEFWRAKRQVAGVLHFCGLGYSKPGVPTSDHFVDIEKLTLEPYFAKYVRDAFAPVGLMIDFWDDQMVAAETCPISVVVVNDLDEDWDGKVRLAVVRDGIGRARCGSRIAALPGWARRRSRSTSPARRARPVSTGCPTHPPRPAGRREPAGFRRGAGGPADRGVGPRQAGHGLFEPCRPSRHANAVDGKAWTRWSSEPSDPQWIAVDLGRPTQISRVWLCWEGISNVGYAKAYRIQVSDDGTPLERRVPNPERHRRHRDRPLPAGRGPLGPDARPGARQSEGHDRLHAL